LSLTLREEHSLRVFENRALRKWWDIKKASWIKRMGGYWRNSSGSG
jgi:hypothetical protein